MDLKEFIRTLCTHCGHCSVKWLDTQTNNFCFIQYEKDSTKFITHTYKKLRQFKTWPVIVSTEREMFIEVFCKAEACGVTNRYGCSTLPDCLASYVDQTLSIGSLNTLDTLDILEVAHETTMICGGSKTWIKQVQKLG